MIECVECYVFGCHLIDCEKYCLLGVISLTDLCNSHACDKSHKQGACPFNIQ